MHFEKVEDEIESRISNILGDIEILSGLLYIYKSINSNVNPDSFTPLLSTYQPIQTLQEFLAMLTSHDPHYQNASDYIAALTVPQRDLYYMVGSDKKHYKLP